VSDRPRFGTEFLLTILTDCMMLKFCPKATARQIKQRCAIMLSKETDEDDCLHRMIAYGVLFMLCLEYSEDPGDALLANRYTVLSRLFLAKLETAIAELPLILVPSMEAVSALVISVSYRSGLLRSQWLLTECRQRSQSTCVNLTWRYT
jgi:hypothetical protein